MIIRIAYYGPARKIADREDEMLEVAAGQSVGNIIRLLAEKYGEKMSWLLLTESGTPRRSIIFAVNDEAVESVDEKVLCDEDTFSILPAVSGG